MWGLRTALNWRCSVASEDSIHAYTASCHEPCSFSSFSWRRELQCSSIETRLRLSDYSACPLSESCQFTSYENNTPASTPPPPQSYNRGPPAAACAPCRAVHNLLLIVSLEPLSSWTELNLKAQHLPHRTVKSQSKTYRNVDTKLWIQGWKCLFKHVYSCHGSPSVEQQRDGVQTENSRLEF